MVNKNTDVSTLADLKHLMKEAKQYIPPFLEAVTAEISTSIEEGCGFCGGLGHRMVNCPKLEV